MGKQLISVSGGTALYLHDEQDGKRALESVTDVSAIAERAKARHNEGLHRTGMGDSHTASIPMELLKSWAARIGKTWSDVLDDPKLMDRFLQDPDHKFFIIDPTSVPR
jgi:hypothetical protein